MTDALQISGGLLSGLLAVKFDQTKIVWDKVDVGIASTLDGLEPAVITTGNYDLMVFTAIKQAIHDQLAKLKAPANGNLVVGATQFKWRRSREEVEKIVVSNGMQVSDFAPWVLLVAQYIPMLIDLIKYLKDWLSNNKPVLPA